MANSVLCNCDDPKVSNFFHYFAHNFERLKLKKLITTCYKNCDADLFSMHRAEKGIHLEYNGDKDDNRVPDPDEIGIHRLRGDGDFRSEECVTLLKQADIIVTNPPFSLFRGYVAQLITHNKKFVIVGNHNATTYKEIFKLFKEDKIWLGHSIHSGNQSRPHGLTVMANVVDLLKHEPVAGRWWIVTEAILGLAPRPRPILGRRARRRPVWALRS